jgi:hypothetical protein
MTVDTFIENLGTAIINPLIQLMFAAALVIFLWGIFQFIKDSDSDTARDLGKKHMLWGLVGMFIMTGVYGILQMLIRTVFGG